MWGIGGIVYILVNLACDRGGDFLNLNMNDSYQGQAWFFLFLNLLLPFLLAFYSMEDVWDEQVFIYFDRLINSIF